MKPPGLSGWSASGYAFKLGNAPKRPLSETQLVKHVLKALAMEPGVTAWRCQSGRRAGISFGLGKGAADVIACVGPYGRFLAIELKTKTGKQSEAQRHWQIELETMGGVYALCRDVAEARAAVQFTRRQR